MKTAKGLVLEGRYELVSLIATGGMGQVWKGRDQELDREIAIKVLREEYAGDEGFLKRFRAEARHTAALSHDSIAALYDYGELDGRAYIVMELCPGRPLSDIIEENPGGLPEKRVVSVLIELARALDAAHSKGVVHRDVKPENVLVDEKNDWSMKITDFGIARSKDQARLTKTGLVMGTAQYLSPEQAMGKQATSLSDIYALGIVAYEMLVGHRPFTGSSQVEIAMAQVKQQPPELPESINPDLRRLVMMTLAKAPANRPRSAAGAARILEAIQRGVEPRFTTGAIPMTRVEDHDWTGENRVGGTDGAPSPATHGAGAAGSAPAKSAGSAGPGRSVRSAGSASSANARGSGSSRRSRRGASPTGTRTAAMPLPLSGRGRGIRHRSSSSAMSGSSASSASSAVSASSASSAPRGGAGKRGPAAPPAGRSPASGMSAASSLSAASAVSASSPSSPPSGSGDADRASTEARRRLGLAGVRDSGPSGRTVRTAQTGRTTGTSTGRRVGPLSVPGLILLVLLIAVVLIAVAGGLGWLPIGATGIGHVEFGEQAVARTMFESVGDDLVMRTGVE